jgi:hypothetical protein
MTRQTRSAVSRRPYVPAFYPVPVRSRRDGWTPARQVHFLGLLAETGSVLAACKAVGMSRNSAYRLRRKRDAESFAAAWDAALGEPKRKVTVEDLDYLAVHGLIRPRFYRGRYVGFSQNPSNSALLRLNARFDRLLDGIACGRAG